MKLASVAVVVNGMRKCKNLCRDELEVAGVSAGPNSSTHQLSRQDLAVLGCQIDLLIMYKVK